MADQLQACVRHGLDVVTSCEELAFDGDPPWLDAVKRRQVSELDRNAVEHGATVLATGVNPGFAMDTLPITLSAVCADIRGIRIARVLDATNRRLPFQRKIGAGLRPEEFDAKAAAGGFGHIGLRESALSVAHAFGWEPFEIEDELHAITAGRAVTTANLSVEPGEVAGLRQRLLVRHLGQVKITMELVMAMGARDPRDEVVIDSDPPIRCVIEGGVQGDRATVGIMINAARAITTAPRGLISMRQLPPVHWRSNTR